MVTGFTLLSRLTQTALPSTRFVFLGAEFRFGLPSHPPHDDAVASGLEFTPPLSPKGLPPPIDRPCRAYSSTAFGGGRPARVARPDSAAHAPDARCLPVAGTDRVLLSPIVSRRDTW